MQLLSRSEFQVLSESAADYSASIYLPTHVAGPEIRQDPIRLKNLLSETEDKLLQAGMAQDAVTTMLEPGMALLDDQPFWRYQSCGLALFLTPEGMKLYRLPLEFESLAVVSDRFHLKPLLPLFFDNRYFYVLALSQNQVRFFQATRYQISEVSLVNVPTSLAEALKYDDPEEQVQFHSSDRGGSQPVYHGQGGGTGDDKINIQRFLTKVSNGLHPYLNQEEAPLVLASVDYLQPLYQDVNTYSHLLADGIEGNPDVAQPDELRQAAWEKVAPLIEQSHQQALEQYHTLLGTGKASEQLAQVLSAAHRGQIDTLFTTANAHCWGEFDPASGQMEEHDPAQPQDRDLLDLAAVQTFLQGGTVYVLDADSMPASVPAAAIYRYGVPAEV